nr:immunoglobulin light chain junction region [Macaca mulatta]MOW40924.1 immunoglobulin light chain junction region [Macaca mulatta]MOW41136.1 immunoglobulin light chain junction region [Macaca mulatta]MOW41599.1 immunoglobulin light chain junction region [Macaca mulatta]MOW41739.1 immunoglobulin light chain junction region [Macaca mulatta]
CQQYYTDPFTF